MNAPGGFESTSRGRYAAQAWQRSTTFRIALDRAARPASAAPVMRPPTKSGVMRVDQSARNEYENDAQARVWSGSTCSAAALTAVLRGKGVQAHISDVMKAMPGALTPELGLISRPGLVRAAAKFGVDARDDVQGFDALQQATGAGQAVLIDVRNGQFPEGHWMVATRTSAAGVDLVDSSSYRISSMSRDQFSRAWSGRGIRIAN